MRIHERRQYETKGNNNKSKTPGQSTINKNKYKELIGHEQP